MLGIKERFVDGQTGKIQVFSNKGKPFKNSSKIDLGPSVQGLCVLHSSRDQILLT